MRTKIAALVFATMVVSPAAQSDGHVGKWVLNTSKSKFTNGPGLQSQTVTFTSAADGAYKFTSQQTNPDGKQLTIEWTAKSDGKEYPVTGHPVADMVSMKNVNAITTEASLTLKGKAAQRIRFELLPGGKTMAATVTGATSFSSASTNNNVHVLEKQ